ncbi:hypothetical protein BGZ57DRAFT_908014 [Hyaloscypha finlandica]|nr:hypothetical protein BGZ57DRAFT_908014 [Hyaloscypha finlandica]KAH8770377.1 hypothetical protein F5882DRAFT_411552 [Hyaloscypha sp. PMI_1271]
MHFKRHLFLLIFGLEPSPILLQPRKRLPQKHNIDYDSRQSAPRRPSEMHQWQAHDQNDGRHSQRKSYPPRTNDKGMWLVESPVEECNAGHAEYCKCECCRGRPHSIVSRPLNSNLGFSVVLTDGS